MEEDGKRFARKALKLVDHDTHIFARDGETKHLAREMENVEILSNTTKAGLEDETNQILIETDGGATKACNKMKSHGGEGDARTHQETEALRHQGGKLDP